MEKFSKLLLYIARFLFIIIIYNELNNRNIFIEQYLPIMLLIPFTFKGVRPLFLDKNSDKLSFFLQQFLYFCLLVFIINNRLIFDNLNINLLLIIGYILFDVSLCFIPLLNDNKVNINKIIFYIFLIFVNYAVFHYFIKTHSSFFLYKNINSYFVLYILTVFLFIISFFYQVSYIKNNRILKNLISFVFPIVGSFSILLRYNYCIENKIMEIEKAVFLFYYFLPMFIIVLIVKIFKIDEFLNQK